MQAKCDLLYQGIEKCRSEGSICTISNGFAAYSGDVITQYSFGFSYDHLQSDGFRENLHPAFMAVSEFGHVTLQFPWVKPVLDALPESMIKSMNPPLEKLLQLQKVERPSVHILAECDSANVR